MKVKTINELVKLRDSTQTVLEKILKRVPIQLYKEASKGFPVNVDTTNVYIKKCLKKKVIPRDVYGGRIVHKVKKNKY